MRIYLLRHGSAEQRAGGADSPGRQLVAKGREQCRLAADLFLRMELRFDGALTSPYLRARQTAEAVLEGSRQQVPLAEDKRLVPGASPSAAFEAILAVKASRLLVCGHEPLLSDLAAQLIGAPSAALTLKKGGIVELELWQPRPARAALRGWLRPAHLRAARASDR